MRSLNSKSSGNKIEEGLKIYTIVILNYAITMIAMNHMLIFWAVDMFINFIVWHASNNKETGDINHSC